MRELQKGCGTADSVMANGILIRESLDDPTGGGPESGGRKGCWPGRSGTSEYVDV